MRSSGQAHGWPVAYYRSRLAFTMMAAMAAAVSAISALRFVSDGGAARLGWIAFGRCR